MYSKKVVIEEAKKIKALGLNSNELHRKLQNLAERIYEIRKFLELATIESEINSLRKKLFSLYSIRDAIYMCISNLV